MIDYEEIEGEWTDQFPEGGHLPITHEEYIANLRINLKRDLPNVKNVPVHDKTMIMVCGGPTVESFLDEIKEKNKDSRYDVFCSNNTHDWLISVGIIPYAQFMIDPKAIKVKDVEKPHKDVRYMIGAQCNPGVFDALEGHDVHRIVSCSNLQDVSGVRDFQMAASFLDHETYTNLFGGTMAGLRAMNLADMLGYQTVEFYGFDSCFFDYYENGKPKFYSYPKDRAESILEVKTADGNTWLSSPVFASQARQFLKWKHRLAWMNFIIHGDNFTANLNRLDEEENKRLHDKRFSDLHIQLNKNLHESENPADRFGYVSKMFAGHVSLLAGQIIKKYGPQTLLDYGCGEASLEERMPPITGLKILLYDPAIAEFSEEPKPTGIVVCTDVLEHVEMDCIENVLDHLMEITEIVCFCTIATVPSKKTYSNGMNCHLIVKDLTWWYPKLRKRFDVVEQEQAKGRLQFILQKKGLNA